jgi:hypothetical protein
VSDLIWLGVWDWEGVPDCDGERVWLEVEDKLWDCVELGDVVRVGDVETEDVPLELGVSVIEAVIVWDQLGLCDAL